jgi:hypothetical protein
MNQVPAWFSKQRPGKQLSTPYIFPDGYSTLQIKFNRSGTANGKYFNAMIDMCRELL